MTDFLEELSKKIDLNGEWTVRVSIFQEVYLRFIRNEISAEIQYDIFGISKNKIVVYVVGLWLRGGIVRPEGYQSPLLLACGNSKWKILQQISQEGQRSNVIYPLIGPCFQRVLLFHCTRAHEP